MATRFSGSQRENVSLALLGGLLDSLLGNFLRGRLGDLLGSLLSNFLLGHGNILRPKFFAARCLSIN